MAMLPEDVGVGSPKARKAEVGDLSFVMETMSNIIANWTIVGSVF